MKLYYSYCQKGNFGDDLNPYIFTRLFPGLLDEDQQEILVGIGTILNHKVPKEPFKYVFGSGFGYGGRPDLSTNRWKIYCVRGPLTARFLGVDRSLAATDPAALISRYVPSFNGKPNGYGFIPHFESLDLGFWPEAALRAGLRFINPRGPITEVLNGIQSCQIVITESMHGAIVADSLRIPWIAIRPLVDSHRKKWHDWANSLEIALHPKTLVPSSRKEAINTIWHRVREPVKNLLASNWLTVKLLNNAPQTEALAFHQNNVKPSPKIFINTSDCSTSVKRMPLLQDHAYIERAVCRLMELCRCEPQLSSEEAFSRALERLDNAAQRLRRDFNLPAA